MADKLYFWDGDAFDKSICIDEIGFSRTFNQANENNDILKLLVYL